MFARADAAAASAATSSDGQSSAVTLIPVSVNSLLVYYEKIQETG